MKPIEVADEEIRQYFIARKKILKEKNNLMTTIEYSKYSIKSWKASGLPLKKYLYIADFIDVERRKAKQV